MKHRESDHSHHRRLKAVRCLWMAVALHLGGSAVNAAPLSLHPENPHYFLFRGRPTVLITSGEHYGAVVNLDFDGRQYLRTLEKDHLNLTRVFAGAYVEPVGAFNIARNTLAPGPGRFLCPWARSTVAGYANGGNKFDLSQWDPGYFKRLRTFLRDANARGIVVELNLFCPFYEENIWALSPMNAANNINGIGNIARTNVYTLDRSGSLLEIQEKLVRKLVTELRDFDNLYYEICNEPYFGGVTLEWQRHIAQLITQTESRWSRRHLISQNIANNKATVENPDPNVSIFNFHYASPPDAVEMNYHLNKVIGENETGFQGTENAHYRKEAWQFVLAGGGLFNNLDYSFVAGHEHGDFSYPKSQPGGGNPVYRLQLRHLHQFIHRFDFLRMKPHRDIVKSGLPAKARVYALSEPGKQYALYLFGGHEVTLELDIAPGDYQVEWLDPVTGKRTRSPNLKHSSGQGPARLVSPSYTEDVALRISR